MKTFFLLIAIAVLASACNNLETYFKTTGQKQTESPRPNPVAFDTIAVARDTSLTPAVAYNDIFLDSLAVENWLQKQTLTNGAAPALRNFYKKRNYQAAWLYSGGFTEAGRNFWNLYTRDSTTAVNTQKQGAAFTRIDTLLARDTFHVTPTDSAMMAMELSMTQQFLPYAQTTLTTVPLSLLLPVRKMTTLQWADTILNQPFASADGDTAQAPYGQLKKVLRQYFDTARQGGWKALTLTQKLEPATRAPEVTAIKKRLHLLGIYPADDTTAVYNDTLATVVRTLQQQAGLEANGILNDSVLRLLNVPVEQRMQQLIVNLTRILWTPQPPQNYVQVNIPEFMLHVHEGDRTAFSMPVVVGKEGTGTVLFTGTLNQLVFSPYWNIPASIVRDELLPEIRKDPAYLKRRGMEVVGKTDSMPKVRQLPGGDNPMGKVKFLFPNRWDIYFHDTPAKELFDQEKRAFSHGCIRLADAEKLASYLLRGDQVWTPEKVRQAMNSGTEQFVTLKTAVPVVISYYTAWVDDQGRLQWRDDVYGHDRKAASLLFLNNNVV